MSPATDESRTTFRPAAVLLVATGAILLLTGILVHAPALLLMAVPLLIAPMAGALDQPPVVGTARLDWRESGEGPSVIVDGSIELPTGMDARSVALTFYRPSPLEESHPPKIERERGEIRFHLDWHAPFPCLARVPWPQATWRDPLGVVERRLLLDGPGVTIRRFPPELNRPSSIKLNRTTPLPGEVLSPVLGAHGEFFTVRPSIGTDTPRQINWKATARWGRRLSNDYRLERTGDLLVVLDLRPTPLGSAVDDALLSTACAAAVGIATGSLRAKHRVGLAIFEEYVRAVPLGSGRRQLHRIEEALSRASTPAEAAPSERLAVSLRRFFPPGVTTLLISPLTDDASAAAVPHLRRRGFPTIVLSPSPIAFMQDSDREGPEGTLAARLMALVRRRRTVPLSSIAPVIDWSDLWSLAPLVNYLRRPWSQRRRV